VEMSALASWITAGAIVGGYAIVIGIKLAYDLWRDRARERK
jgi:hypothetical protein